MSFVPVVEETADPAAADHHDFLDQVVAVFLGDPALFGDGADHAAVFGVEIDPRLFVFGGHPPQHSGIRGIAVLPENCGPGDVFHSSFLIFRLPASI